MRQFFTLAILLFLATSMFAQRNCGSMDYLQEQIEANPERQMQLDQLEIFTRQYAAEEDSRELNNGVVTIPVIVHVLYQNSTENISDNQIQSQIDVLNDDFRRMNADASNTPADFVGVAADTDIEFCLIQTIRVSTNVNSFGTNDAMKFSSSGGSDVVTPGSAMNMWVCEIGGGILGYAQFPGGSASTDGIVIDYRYFGTTGTATAPFDRGRTATHEVGHYLNLRHIWGDGGCNVDDFVSDTPSAGGPNYTGGPCTYPGPNSCTPKGRPGQPDDFDMFQNYMDYSDDVCMNLFTQGQKTRMWAAINSSRPGLLSAACDGTPPPPPPPTEICDNNIDDDGDGLTDCDDPDCGSDPNCSTPGTCDAPTGLTHERRKGGREALLGWNASAGASSYDVEVYNASGGLHASGNVASTSATVGGLTKNAAYTWRVRANCSGSTSAWTDGAFNARLGNANSLSSKEIYAFPNPSNQGYVNLSWDLPAGLDLTNGIYETNARNNENVFIQMFDINGKAALSLQADSGVSNQQLDVSNLTSGMYIIQITNDAGYTARLKFLRQ